MAVTLLHAGQRISLSHTGQNLARLLWLDGPLPPRPLCLGIGTCGQCRIRFLSPPPDPTETEQRLLHPEELKNNIRLACRHTAKDGMEVTVVQGNFDSVSLTANDIANTRPTNLLLAVDMGTTSIAWQAETTEGTIIAQGQFLNPQMGAGNDFISRLAEAASPHKAAHLQELVLTSLKEVVGNLEQKGHTVTRMGLAANPAITALTLGMDASALRTAPYSLNYAGNCLVTLPDLPPLWIPPLVGGFVGGDAVCGLALLAKSPAPFLLADMGTNCEFLLQTADTLYAASVPLGPALEGMGMRCGSLAGPGAVTSYRLTPRGLEGILDYGGTPQTITGTGYLTLVHGLLDAGILTPQGLFAQINALKPRPGLEAISRKLAKAVHVDTKGMPTLCLEGTLRLEAQDVENLLKVKSAFATALGLLLDKAGLHGNELEHIYIGGALGLHAPVHSLVRLGFLPPHAEMKTTALGNSSLQGLALLLREVAQSPALLLEAIVAKCRTATVLDLTADPLFYQRYIQHMCFDEQELL